MRGLLLWGYQRLMLNGLASGQYARAETWLDKIERIEGRSRRVLHNRALIRMALSDYAGAEALLEEQVAAFGELSGLLRALAECGYLAGDREQAVRRLDAALADPDCADRSLLEQRRALAGDAARYARAMEGKRVFAEGNAKYAAQDLAGARAAFEQAVAADPTDFVARNNLGSLLLNHFGEAAAAAVLFEEAIALTNQLVFRRNLAAAREHTATKPK